MTPRTPYPVVSASRLKTNIARMQQLANRAGVRLRPHSKTHKSPVIAQMQLDAGAIGICCAKLAEAEIFATHGIRDIRLPYPINPSNADRVLALMEHSTVSIVVDDEQVAREWSSCMTPSGRTLDILVKIDVGFHRCGMDPAASGLVDRIARIAALPGLKFRGLLSHAGQAYQATSAADLASMAATETSIMTGLAAQLRTAGVTVDEISVGSTPTASLAATQVGITEMRPGNYVFFDRTQVGLEAATIEHCALFVVATVVSRPAPDRVILDCGSKTLTTDGCRGFAPSPGHGLVFLTTGDTPDPSIVIERLSEEHATCRVSPACALKPGDRVRVLPNHACTVTNLMDTLMLAGDDGSLETLEVAARGRIW